MIFGIIHSEGGYKEASAVTQDCLEICCNVLDGSDMCQRLFYGMDGAWHMRLLDFLSPVLLEGLSRKAPGQSPSHPDSDDRDNTFMDFAQHGPWFEQTGRLRCAVLSARCLAVSLGSTGAHHAALTAAVEPILATCAHWIIRSGPAELLPSCFAILDALVTGPDQSANAHRMLTMLLRYQPSASSLSIPTGLSPTPLLFSWKLTGGDERRAMSFSCLLAERYLFPVHCWWGHDPAARTLTSPHKTPATPLRIYLVGNEFWMGAMLLLENVLAADDSLSSMIIQTILAPPPPPMDMDMEETDDIIDQAAAEGIQSEVGSLVLSVLLNSLERIMVHQGGPSASMQPSLQTEAATAIRAANIMSVVLVQGHHIARELCTAINTLHLVSSRAALDAAFKSQNNPSSSGSPLPLLPFLLSLCSRLVRVPGMGFNVAGAVLRLLTAAACNCPRAATQVGDIVMNRCTRIADL